ncbi:hypothetical protein YB2330_002627 [Saitoella coloradoensis]
MQWHTGLLSLLFALLVTFYKPVSAIYADEASVIDFHLAHVGTPRVSFLHAPVVGSGKLAYVGTEKNVIAAIGLKSGDLLWRQIVEGDLVDAKASGERIVVLSQSGTNVILSAYSATQGHLLWSSPFLSQEAIEPSVSVSDVNAVLLTDGGLVRTVDLTDGTVAASWSGHDGVTVYTNVTHTADGHIAVVGTTSNIASSTLSTTMLDAYTLALSEILVLDTTVMSPSDVLHLSPRLLIWKNGETLEYVTLGKAQVRELQAPANVGHALAFSSRTGRSILVQFHHSATFYTVSAEDGSLVLKYTIQNPGGSDHCAYSAAESDEEFYTRSCIQGDIGHVEVFGVAESGVVKSWRVDLAAAHSTGHFGGVLAASSEIMTAVDGLMGRVLLVTVDGSIHMWRDSMPLWTRHESLAHTTHATFVDLPDPSVSKEMADEETHEGLSAFLKRVTRHIGEAHHIPAFISGWATRFAQGEYEASPTGTSAGIARDTFGFRKFIVTGTEKGKLAALDTATGKVVWSQFYQGNSAVGLWTVRNASPDHPPVVAVLLKGQGTMDWLELNALDGTVVGSESWTGSFGAAFAIEGIQGPEDTLSVAVVSQEGALKVFPKDKGMQAISATSTGIRFAFTNGSSAVQGFELDATTASAKSLWKIDFPSAEVVQSISAAGSNHVASIGRVLGDRSVMYKYLHSQLAGIVTTDASASSVTIYLVDLARGTIVHQARHGDVDITKSVSIELDENRVVYAFWSVGPSAGTQINVLELYEHEKPNQRFDPVPLDYVSRDVDLQPYVVGQAYFYPARISALATTQTRYGITKRDTIAFLPDLNMLVELPKSLLDPRRPKKDMKQMSTAEKEEGLMPYDPILPDERRWVISHQNEIFAVKDIISSPAYLESTSLVFAFGLDMFFTRVTPSQSFDKLSASFSKGQLVLTMIALCAAVGLTSPMVRKKQLNALWGVQ